MVYNFQRPVLTINPNLDLFLKTISQDRTEVKIATTTDNNIFYANYLNHRIEQLDLVKIMNWVKEIMNCGVNIYQ